MIYGIGIDIVMTERMKNAVLRWNRKFLERVFTESEIQYAYTKSDPYLALSVRFAAKEAVIKAVGGAIPISFTDVEILNSKSGRPSLSVSGSLRAFFENNMICCSHVSLSHEREYGVACVVLETSRPQ